MYTCKYCEDKFDNKEDLQMHEINCKSNPYSHAHAIDKNNFVYPIHEKGVNKL